MKRWHTNISYIIILENAYNYECETGSKISVTSCDSLMIIKLKNESITFTYYMDEIEVKNMMVYDYFYRTLITLSRQEMLRQKYVKEGIS